MSAEADSWVDNITCQQIDYFLYNEKQNSITVLLCIASAEDINKIKSNLSPKIFFVGFLLLPKILSFPHSLFLIIFIFF